jgi:hypothetical protein
MRRLLTSIGTVAALCVSAFAFAYEVRFGTDYWYPFVYERPFITQVDLTIYNDSDQWLTIEDYSDNAAIGNRSMKLKPGQSILARVRYDYGAEFTAFVVKERNITITLENDSLGVYNCTKAVCAFQQRVKDGRAWVRIGDASE